MSISTELTALQADVTAARSAIATKGGTVTSGGGSSQLATDIATIPGAPAQYRVDTMNAGGGIISSEFVGYAKLPNYSFNGVTTLTNVTLPDEMARIGASAFSSCSNLVLTEFPSSLTTIDSFGFFSCAKIALTELPSGLTYIGSYAFANCTSLALTALPSGLSLMYEYAFANCTNLALSELPSSLRSIGVQAFKNCTSLASKFKIRGSSTLQVGNYGNANSFQGCTSLQKVWIGNAGTIYTTGSSYPFIDCTNLTDIYTPLASKPSGWGENWNRINASTTATVHWGVSEAEFDAL